MKEQSNIEQIAIDALLEKPITFKLDGRFFYVYQPSIGISMLSKQILERLQLNKNLTAVNPTFAILNAVREQKNDILRLIAIHTFADRRVAMKEEAVVKRIKELGSMGIDNMTAVLMGVFEWQSWQEKIEKEYHIDIERQKREEVSRAKEDDKSSITFGGLSMWGSMIDFACERYGWSVEYVVWGVSALNLSLMMADSINSVYLTDKERRRVNISNDRKYFSGDSKKGAKKFVQSLKG